MLLALSIIESTFIKVTNGVINIKRSIKHHFIPQFYLNNFTETGDKNSYIWITDTFKCKQWRAYPSSIAYENRLYSLENKETKDVEEDLIEKAFSRLEDLAAPVIRDIINTEEIPSGDEYNILMTFIAHLASRTPVMIAQRRNQIP